MRNVLQFYYQLKPKNIHQYEKIIKFLIDDEKYYFYPFNRPLEDAKALLDLNRLMMERNLLVHEIILNKDKQVLTFVNGVPYILFRVYVNEKTPVRLSDVYYLSRNTVQVKVNKVLNRTDWVKLWEDKMDYFEYQMSQIGKRYPLINESFSYFLGMSENAIAYVQNTFREMQTSDMKLVVSHKRVTAKDTLLDFYNPITYVFDYESRDLSEYIKSHFFVSARDLWPELNAYFYSNRISVFGLRLLYGRLLYPSYYFDLYEKIVGGQLEEKELLSVLEKREEYEEFLHDFYDYVQSYLHVVLPEVEWITKK